MVISFDVPPEIEEILQRRAAAAGEDLSTFVRHVVTESLTFDAEPVTRATSPEEFARRLQAWIDLHPILDHEIDDSRESIYSGRGE
jgi:hypothetical protein